MSFQESTDHNQDQSAAHCFRHHAGWLQPFVRLLILTLVLGALTRIILLFNPSTLGALPLASTMQAFILGAVNDTLIALLGFSFILGHLLLSGDWKFRRHVGGVLLFVLIALWLYIGWMCTPLREFNRPLQDILSYILLYKWISFALRLCLPGIRTTWTRTVYCLFVFLYVFAFLFNVIGEYFFWDEFGVRYNFIAVDYLVYTNEVVGNIFESFPMVPLLCGLVILSLGVTYLIVQRHRKIVITPIPEKMKWRVAGIYILAAALCLLSLPGMTVFQNNDNVQANELQANGVYKFYCAYVSNTLEYDKFYPTLPKAQAIAGLRRYYESQQSKAQHIDTGVTPATGNCPNIVLITVESLSADYLGAFGNTEHLTPHLDTLCHKGLVFTNLYAAGNRTVRGLEALTLCQPPCPGESVIKRAHQPRLYSTADVLRPLGYRMQFYYGGDSYFDNMKAYYSALGYEIYDKNTMLDRERTFATVWGCCDEDLFTRTLRQLDHNGNRRPWLAQVMTASNHRPFTYPAGRIDIPPTQKSREGGVKYTDYAIGRFLAEASRRPWFRNTLFIIVADHCASSAGSTELPLDKYHIPAIVYAPGRIQPQVVNKLCSQIDLMPTVFSLFRPSYHSRFYGQDILSPTFRERAFVATYQDLGYLSRGVLTVISPVRRVRQWRTSPAAGGSYSETPLKGTPDQQGLRETIYHYQTLQYQEKQQ